MNTGLDLSRSHASVRERETLGGVVQGFWSTEFIPPKTE